MGRIRSCCGKLIYYSCLLSTALTILSLSSIYLFLYRPATAKHAYEALAAARQNTIASFDQPIKAPPSNTTNPTVPQIWTWSSMLDIGLLHLGWLDPDTSLANTKDLNVWIYLRGTNAGPRPWLSMPDPLTRINSSCVDPLEVCDAYNTAFERLSEEWYVQRDRLNPGTELKLLDCDVSPNLCDLWSSSAVMMVNVRAVEPCRFEIIDVFGYVCSVRWSWVTLPMVEMAYQRNVKVAGRTVPAFPDEYEQLRSLIMFDGSETALEADDAVLTEVVEVDVNYHRPYKGFKKEDLGARGGWWNETLYTWGKGAAEEYMRLRSHVTGGAAQPKQEKGGYDISRPFG